MVEPGEVSDYRHRYLIGRIPSFPLDIKLFLSLGALNVSIL
jgi:hypothetical protein